MKKLILPFIIAIFLMQFVLAEVPVPMPIVGHLTINGVSPTGYQVVVRNLDNPDADVITPTILSSLNTEGGTFMADLSYFGRDSLGVKYTSKSRYYSGDRIQVSIVKDGKGNDFSCSQCIYTTIPPTFPYYFNINIQDSAITVVEKEVIKEVVTPPIVEYVCSDGTKVTNLADCPKVVTPPSIICKDGTIVTDVNACLETKEQVQGFTKTQLGYAGGVGAAFAGLVVYFILKGKRARAEKMLKTRVTKLKK